MIREQKLSWKLYKIFQMWSELDPKHRKYEIVAEFNALRYDGGNIDDYNRVYIVHFSETLHDKKAAAQITSNSFLSLIG